MPTKLHAESTVAPVKEAGANGHRKAVVSALDDILAIDDTVYESVYVPQWQRTIRLVSLTGTDRNRLIQAAQAQSKRFGSADAAEVYLQARVILASWVDADGEHIGDPTNAAQVEALMGKSGGALTRLFLVCARLSGLGPDEEEAAVEALKALPSDATGSD